jgi:glycosyltransferase involved in cell wall biosynthesis
MACRDSAQYLGTAINSLLADAPRDAEIIVLDDGSRDETARIIQTAAASDTRITFLRNECPMGVAIGRNQCAEAAQGEYLVQMDADDVVIPGRIAAQVRFLDDHPEVGVLGGAIELIDARGRTFGTRSYPVDDVQIRSIMYRVSPFANPAVAMRRELFAQIGGYEPRYLYAQDLDLWLRLAKITKFANLNQEVLQYRVHGRSTTAKFIRRIQVRSARLRLRAMIEHGYRPSIVDLVFIFGTVLATVLPLPAILRVFEWIRGRVFATELASDD